MTDSDFWGDEDKDEFTKINMDILSQVSVFDDPRDNNSSFVTRTMEKNAKVKPKIFKYLHKKDQQKEYLAIPDLEEAVIGRHRIIFAPHYILIFDMNHIRYKGIEEYKTKKWLHRRSKELFQHHGQYKCADIGNNQILLVGKGRPILVTANAENQQIKLDVKSDIGGPGNYQDMCFDPVHLIVENNEDPTYRTIIMGEDNVWCSVRYNIIQKKVDAITRGSVPVNISLEEIENKENLKDEEFKSKMDSFQNFEPHLTLLLKEDNLYEITKPYIILHGATNYFSLGEEGEGKFDPTNFENIWKLKKMFLKDFGYDERNIHVKHVSTHSVEKFNGNNITKWLSERQLECGEKVKLKQADSLIYIYVGEGIDDYVNISGLLFPEKMILRTLTNVGYGEIPKIFVFLKSTPGRVTKLNKIRTHINNITDAKNLIIAHNSHHYSDKYVRSHIDQYVEYLISGFKDCLSFNGHVTLPHVFNDVGTSVRTVSTTDGIPTYYNRLWGNTLLTPKTTSSSLQTWKIYNDTQYNFGFLCGADVCEFIIQKDKIYSNIRELRSYVGKQPLENVILALLELFDNKIKKEFACNLYLYMELHKVLRHYETRDEKTRALEIICVVARATGKKFITLKTLIENKNKKKTWEKYFEWASKKWKSNVTKDEWRKLGECIDRVMFSNQGLRPNDDEDEESKRDDSETYDNEPINKSTEKKIDDDDDEEDKGDWVAKQLLDLEEDTLKIENLVPSVIPLVAKQYLRIEYEGNNEGISYEIAEMLVKKFNFEYLYDYTKMTAHALHLKWKKDKYFFTRLGYKISDWHSLALSFMISYYYEIMKHNLEREEKNPKFTLAFGKKDLEIFIGYDCIDPFLDVLGKARDLFLTNKSKSKSNNKTTNTNNTNPKQSNSKTSKNNNNNTNVKNQKHGHIVNNFKNHRRQNSAIPDDVFKHYTVARVKSDQGKKNHQDKKNNPDNKG